PLASAAPGTATGAGSCIPRSCTPDPKHGNDRPQAQARPRHAAPRTRAAPRRPTPSRRLRGDTRGGQDVLRTHGAGAGPRAPQLVHPPRHPRVPTRPNERAAPFHSATSSRQGDPASRANPGGLVGYPTPNAPDATRRAITAMAMSSAADPAHASVPVGADGGPDTVRDRGMPPARAKQGAPM